MHAKIFVTIHPSTTGELEWVAPPEDLVMFQRE